MIEPSLADALPMRADVVVVGAGLAGSAAAWELTRRGRTVVVIEKDEPASRHGSSHGSARIFRRAYADALYVRLTGEAYEGWRELEQAVGETLLRLTGGLDHGTWRGVDGIADRLADAGVAHELLDPVEATERWPGILFDGPVLHHPQAGTVDPERAVAAYLRLACEAGATLVVDTAVSRIDTRGDGAVVRTPIGDVECTTVVVAAGAWVEDVLSGTGISLPPIRVSQQQAFHFPRRDLSVRWPVLIDKSDLSVYALPGGRDGGSAGAVKVAEHDIGGRTSATSRSGIVDLAARQRLVRYVERRFPGLDPRPRSEVTCLFTSTPTEDFVLDQAGPVVVASPCSGHGAKLAPVVGRIVADLVDGRPQDQPQFRLPFHAKSRS